MIPTNKIFSGIENTRHENIKKEDIVQILKYAQLFAMNYHLLINDTTLQTILDIENNSLCKYIKNNNQNFDDITVKCMVLGFYVHFRSSLIS